MNVVIVNDFAYIDGGASKIALGSAKALAQLGRHVTLFTAVGPVDPGLLDRENLEVVLLGQQEVINDPERLRAIVQGFWNVPAQRRMKELLAKLDRADTIVHVHTWTKALSASVVHAALSLGFRVVVTLHDYFSVCPAGSFFIHPRQKICHLNPMSAACISTDCDSRRYSHKLWRVGRHWFQNHLGGLPSEVTDFITLSDLSEDVLSPLLPRQARIHRVRNFIEVDQGPPAEVAAHSLFCFSGRLSPEKGPRLLAECSRLLDMDVLFIGDGPMKEELARTTPRASFTGWVSAGAAREAMLRCRALVFPSLWYETQGLVVAEAAAIGLPVIVPDTSAAREWVDDGRTGLLFRGGDAGDLAAKMTFLRDHPEEAVALGARAYAEYWRQPATLSAHCHSLLQVYEEMLKRRAPGQP